uniref:Transmembrane protein 159 n=1 Tax=Rousettus aegyptiacus TaxID=9407 RepID=A0A7J8F4C9_ROUAE|nr:transmembrane protein 159 [Rousettus aegyptiacus]
MAKEEMPSTSKDFEELQRKLSLLIESIQNNSKMVAFLKSPVGQCLDRHPFVGLASLVFVAVSAVPVGFFLLLVVLTSLAAFVGVIVLEGLVIFVGGLSLLCVLCGLGFVSLAVSGTIVVSYMVVSSLVNYWFSPSWCLEAKGREVGGRCSHSSPDTSHIGRATAVVSCSYCRPARTTAHFVAAATLRGSYY